MVLVLRSPGTGRKKKSLRRATPVKRREARRAEAEAWAAAEASGRVLDVDADDLQALPDGAGGSRLPVFGLLDPYSDMVIRRPDLPQLEADVERLYAAVRHDAALREVVAAVRALLARWRAEPDLVLYCSGD